MTVLHILDHSVPIRSGYSVRSRSIIMFQQRLGLRPVVVTSPKQGASVADLENHDGIPHYRTRPVSTCARTPYLTELILMLRLASRIAHVARRENVRVFHAHSPILNALPALWVARRLGRPLVYEARAFWEDAGVDHGTCSNRSFRYRLSRALETLVFRRADAVVTICQGMQSDLIRRGVPAARLHVVPNGVDTEWFHPAERNPQLASRLGLNGGPVFGFVGSFYRYEGLRFLLDAAPFLVRDLPGARILLVGAGEEEAALRKQAAQLGATVLMPGSMPYHEIRPVYSAIDVFVCPRRRNRLTELVTPLKPLEAMSMARTVLASNVGGLAELVQPEATGLLFEAESQESFVTQAVRAGREHALRAQLGRSARAAMVEHRSWPRIISRYPTIYRDAEARSPRMA